jgi:hypothetical protein
MPSLPTPVNLEGEKELLSNARPVEKLLIETSESTAQASVSNVSGLMRSFLNGY